MAIERRDESRRDFLIGASSAAVGGLLALPTRSSSAGPATLSKVFVELPRLRVPLSFIIDDSTCLVNMGKFCMPQFATAWPERKEYDQPWEKWPHEIPDAFLRKFGEWCASRGVKGKFSIVPNPACVGWLDRELPGWSKKQLQSSLQLVRDVMVPHWDIHPEMITHTRVLDIKTGKPMEPINAGTMENSYPQVDKSVDELTSYLAYALRILKNCDLPCEGITTPGGFGNKVKDKLPLAVFEAVRDVFGTELPHYFKYISEGKESAVPKLEGLRHADSSDPLLTMNVPAGTGDWFGGWDGSRKCDGERYCNEDASQGRMIELIERGEPAVMFCHWAGLYNNGTEEGWVALQKIIEALNDRFVDRTLWMKVSEIGRYWAAKELTKIELREDGLELSAPFACRDFTLRIDRPASAKVLFESNGKSTPLNNVASRRRLEAGTYWLKEDEVYVCFDLPKGRSTLRFS